MATNSIISMYVVGMLLGLIAGFVMHRSDYCVAGMFRDFFLFQHFQAQGTRFADYLDHDSLRNSPAL